ncbi:ribosomal protein S2 [Auriscalpium vulgare]|uniref:Ribosomal protein S2 n=1 Tax=Auriscalpium vulgare TaxID=40419 RepID=A0ACB8S0Q9_9AGAM|nr:ribosomal protein S2 [Auriscalpium vulgare]
MASNHLRALAGRAARHPRAACARRSVASLSGSAEQPDLLQSDEDWTAFQLRKAEARTVVDIFSKFGSTTTRDSGFQPHHSLHRPTPPRDLTLSALLAAGAHMGHSSALLNPNFIPYAYGTRADITVIDLDYTLPMLRRAAALVRDVAARDGTVVFVGTRADLRPAVRKAAERMGSQGYHVGEKWLPGTLTNKLQFFGPEVAKTERVVPDLVVFLNPIPNMHAIRECAIEHVPTIGIVDSNVDPRIVMYPIPANDESTRTAELISGVLSVAGREGVALRVEEDAKREKKKLERPKLRGGRKF